MKLIAIKWSSFSELCSTVLYLTIITRSSVHVVFDNQHSKKWRVTEQNQNRDRESNEVLRSRLADTGRLVPAWFCDKFTRIQENQEVEKTMYETSKARSGNCAASKIRSTVFSIFYMNVKIIEAHGSRRRTTARRFESATMNQKSMRTCQDVVAVASINQSTNRHRRFHSKTPSFTTALAWTG